MIEILEPRIAPALSGVISHGVLTIKGVPDGTVTITELPDGKVQFQSGNNGPATTPGPITYISLLLDTDFARNDTINFNLPTGSVKNLLVYPNGGSDTFNFKTGGDKVSATIYGGDGNDTLNIDAVAGLRYVNFIAGQGTNSMTIAGKVVTNALFNTFDGVDTLNITASANVGKIYTQLRGGNDVIKIDGLVSQFAQLMTHNGNDSITVSAPSRVHVLNIYAGTDNDTISLAGLVDGSIYVDASFGNDTLTLVPGVKALANLTAVMGADNDTVHFAGNFYNANINAGLGNDRVDLYNGFAIGNLLNIALGGGDNIIGSALAASTSLNTAYRVVVTGSTGLDQVQLSGLDVKTSITVSLGAGSNTFQIPIRSFGGEIAAIKAASLIYAGGVGIDTITVQSSESVIGIGTFSLSYGNDVANFSGSRSIFTTALRVYGSVGTDSFSSQSLYANISHVFSSIENLS